MKAATYTAREDKASDMLEILRNGKVVCWADRGNEEATIAELQAEDRADYNETVKDKIAGLLEDCEDTAKLEAILKMLKG